MFRLTAVIVIACASLCAQSNFATLSGRIQDPSQAPVSGARISVTAKATAAVRQAVTNGEGLFEFPNLLPGGYAVQVSAPGFAVETRDVLLEVGQNLALDLALVLGERHETLEIVEAADLLRTQDVSLGEVVEPKSIEDLRSEERRVGKEGRSRWSPGPSKKRSRTDHSISNREGRAPRPCEVTLLRRRR